jgi:hypothetical protein
MAEKIRRYDLDWLRVLVFALLILFHVGMFFNPWGWHIKNNVIYDWLRYPMYFLSQWRLSILFVISGMGTCFALSFRSGRVFAMERIKRLGLPLVVGMILIVPPQVYFERLSTGQFQGTYTQFYFWEAFAGIYPEGNFSWHHLWFLPYLLIYSLLLAPLFVYLRNNPEQAFLGWIKKCLSTRFGWLILVFPLYLAEALLEPFFPVTHALVNDWFTFINFMILFFYGFLFILIGDEFWQRVDELKFRAFLTGILFFTLLLTIRQFEDNIYIHFTEAFIKVINFLAWIVAIFGYGAKYLNQKSTLLTYCNTAVYPFYILHQTITVGLGYYMMNWQTSFFLKFSILAVGTFFFSWLLYEFIIKRINFLRPLFGLKGKYVPN